MSTDNPTCAQRIDDHLKSREATLTALYERVNGDDTDDAEEADYELGNLALAAGTITTLKVGRPHGRRGRPGDLPRGRRGPRRQHRRHHLGAPMTVTDTRFDADPMGGIHDRREDRHGFVYCGWCYDHDPDAQFYGPPRQPWPCPWAIPLKAITLHQPWAAFICAGAKRIETRSWATSYRGWLALHAAAAIPPYLGLGRRGSVKIGDYRIEKTGPGKLTFQGGGMVAPYVGLPLGAIVAVVELIDCVPMLALDADLPYEPHLVVGAPDGDGLVHRALTDEIYGCPMVETPVDDERPYGNFAPGRWAWMLGRVKRLPRAVPCPGGQRIWDVRRRAGVEVAEQVTPLIEQAAA